MPFAQLLDHGSFAAGLLLGAAVVAAAAGWLAARRVREGRGQAERIVASASQEVARLRREQELDLKEAELARRAELDAEERRIRDAGRDLQAQIEQRADLVERRVQQLERRESELETRHAELIATRGELASQLDRQRETLERLAQLDREAARALLLQRVEHDIRDEVGRTILREEQQLAEQAGERARRVLSLAIQRYAAAHTAETTVTVVDLPSEEMKGRIIGREGRNIRTFEKATGVELVVDDTPGVVLVSGFDPIRRQVARLALDKLILDGRIHPARIEELVDEARAEIDAQTVAAGLDATHEANVAGLDRRLVETLGRLRFRTSYSQNVLRHSIEVAHLTGVMAAEIGLDPALARRCGLLHDVGKALDHELEGPHTTLGADLARRCAEPPEVIDAAARHHDDLRIDGGIYTILVAAADAISASRPGARRETLEKYVRRLADLEALAGGFPGVEQAFALQAGRELRIIADSRSLDDAGAAKLCRDLARAIQQELHFPGEVKVTVLRETRAIDYAR